MANLPSWPEIVALVRSPKPPLRARVVEYDGARTVRSAFVTFDGLGGWFINDGERIEFRTADDRVVLIGQGRIEAFLGEPTVVANTWVKSLFDPAQMNLDDANGTVYARESVGGRECWVVEASGLGADNEGPLVWHVDVETGVTIQMARTDIPDIKLGVEDLETGTRTVLLEELDTEVRQPPERSG